MALSFCLAISQPILSQKSVSWNIATVAMQTSLITRHLKLLKAIAANELVCRKLILLCFEGHILVKIEGAHLRIFPNSMFCCVLRGTLEDFAKFNGAHLSQFLRCWSK